LRKIIRRVWLGSGADKKTGDFGADVVARKNGRIMIVQCKRWSNPVGLKAVQEAHAAILHYNGDCAIVVATAGYTSSAKAQVFAYWITGI